jgi:uncharacterized metal-binding protein
MANYIAVQLDRRGLADMSCIAGVGGDVPSLVKTAREAERILAIDGCALHCVLHTLRRHGVTPDAHFVLSSAGVRKRFHEDFAVEDAETVLQQVVVEQNLVPKGEIKAVTIPPAGSD